MCKEPRYQHDSNENHGLRDLHGAPVYEDIDFSSTPKVNLNYRETSKPSSRSLVAWRRALPLSKEIIERMILSNTKLARSRTF
jgi:hypothetical protein